MTPEESAAHFAGWNIVEYNGENHEDIVKALKFEVGDCVIMAPDRPIVVQGEVLQRLKRGELSVSTQLVPGPNVPRRDEMGR